MATPGCKFYRHFSLNIAYMVVQVAFYGLGLNQATILQAIGYGGGKTVYNQLYNLAAGNCILICAGGKFSNADYTRSY
jgi:PHS family inorganic phosphate transporter-like MFS transporter